MSLTSFEKAIAYFFIGSRIVTNLGYSSNNFVLFRLI